MYGKVREFGATRKVTRFLFFKTTINGEWRRWERATILQQWNSPDQNGLFEWCNIDWASPPTGREVLNRDGPRPIEVVSCQRGSHTL